MANPIFNALQGNQNNNTLMQFKNFMNQMQGQDPNAILNNLISTGRISQNQLNQAQNVAMQMRGQFDGIKSMFGFK